MRKKKIKTVPSPPRPRFNNNPPFVVMEKCNCVVMDPEDMLIDEKEDSLRQVGLVGTQSAITLLEKYIECLFCFFIHSDSYELTVQYVSKLRPSQET
ncbi:hypothetical protein TNCT_708841 [Trichonephila clavata]|uniref:Uncharacterized protein n=1 Tax=Trichonephila clavata TaxID=2740835 RepID=A0A8X6FRW8_TRICU|nr:hypothetical protein TNCT_708841 [Trichonephila clavata]